MVSLVECNGFNYIIACPFCGEYITTVEFSKMPLSFQEEEDYTCPNCNLDFKVKPNFELKGFNYKL